MIEKVSVIIPTYNREKTILRALQSVLDQTYTNLEVLIIDDGSTDGTADIIKNVEDTRVKYIALEKNGGPSNARNVGVQMAEGEWIAFQDSDDCWHKDKLERQISYHNVHPGYSLIYCMSHVYFQGGREGIVPQEPLPAIMEGKMTHTLLQRNVIDTPTMFIKRECFLSVGGFDVTYKALEDWEFALRFSKQYEIGYLPEILMDSYMLDGGVSANLGAFYEARCKMLGQYKAEMIQEGVFDAVMRDILLRAQNMGLLDTVKKMMMLYLSR